MIIYYFINGLTVLSLLLLWFYSPLKITLGKVLFKKDLITPDEFDDIVFIYNSFLGKLQSCYICSSFWLSLGTGIVYTFIFSLPIYWPFLMFFTFPSIAYFYRKIIS